MTDSGQAQYYWCLRHRCVEPAADTCVARYTLGPYSSADEAREALERVWHRNEEWDAEDARWAGEAT